MALGLPTVHQHTGEEIPAAAGEHWGCFQPHGSRHHEADEEAHGVLVT